jgi:hypothetical protein
VLASCVTADPLAVALTHPELKCWLPATSICSHGVLSSGRLMCNRCCSVICTAGIGVNNFRQVADTLEFGMQAQVSSVLISAAQCVLNAALRRTL